YHHIIDIFCYLKFYTIIKKPRFSVIPVLNRFHKSDAPRWAIVLFIKRSCFASDSASEQLGVSSSCSEVCIAIPYSSIIDGRVSTVLNFLEVGCSIFPMVESIPCPENLVLPRSSQYLPLSLWNPYSLLR